MIKYLGIAILFLMMILLTGCGSADTINDKPEIAPICPDGRYWMDATKSCEIPIDDFAQE